MSALTVLYLILPFPIAFIIHDVEEIIFQHKWMLSHKDSLVERFPRISPMVESLSQLSTKAFAIAALEELLLILLATAYVLVNGPYCMEVWSVLFLAFSIHLLVHIAQGIILKGYVPGLVTSILLLPYAYLGVGSIWNAMSIFEIVLFSLMGILVMALNLKFAHWLGLKLTR